MIDRKTVIKEAVTDEKMLTTVETTRSTNLLARELAEAGAAAGTAVMAETQTGGRGRMGRSFWSPGESGMYLSVIVRPGEHCGRFTCAGPCGTDGLIPLLTVIAGVCVSESIDELFGACTQLKWVNDIMIGGRKAGGILTEGRFVSQSPMYAVIGIGVNIYPPAGGFPDDLIEIAGSVLPERPDPESGNDLSRELLAGRIIRKMTGTVAKFEAEPETLRESLYDAYYDRVKWMFGRPIDVRTPSGDLLYTAEATGLSKDFGLIVKNSSGSVQSLSSGEVSVRFGPVT
ncbi:MAG: biotin--[acetyl-CoA-carboxylase] ligase [Clostridia bacterium]|nr:biotin--[acetyl-CoA-carboxylase] ligase [Clostridia bacterium]